MKRSLISLAVLQATAHAKSTETLAEAAGWLKPIITKEMKAGTQSMLADKRPKAKPVEHGGGSGGIEKSLKADDRKPRIIHIGGGCSDMSLAIPTSRGPAQFGQQQVIAAPVAFA